jgi:hypothetical protein
MEEARIKDATQTLNTALLPLILAGAMQGFEYMPNFTAGLR